jgi:hypothetical protein
VLSEGRVFVKTKRSRGMVIDTPRAEVAMRAVRSLWLMDALR